MTAIVTIPLLSTQRDLKNALAKLVEKDERLVHILEISGVPRLRRRETGFRGVAEIVCAQQVSTASAMAIWKRLDAALHPLGPESLLSTPDARLTEVGLSRAKIKTLKAVASALVSGEADLGKLEREEFERARAQLTALHGIGPWTADIYLLFCAGHGDAWPSGDLAIQEAVKQGLGLEKRPTSPELIKISAKWQPYRGAAAHLWWAYYRVLKQRTGMPFTEDGADRVLHRARAGQSAAPTRPARLNKGDKSTVARS